ncbi:hypothetical protein LZ31DRAFT_372944 [Colletotrichum somersetense]|nr:hypothetical protein LZ31DRAFT_372944 [Colletotrichum somersetense]
MRYQVIQHPHDSKAMEGYKCHKIRGMQENISMSVGFFNKKHNGVWCLRTCIATSFSLAYLPVIHSGIVDMLWQAGLFR